MHTNSQDDPTQPFANTKAAVRLVWSESERWLVSFNLFFIFIFKFKVSISLLFRPDKMITTIAAKSARFSHRRSSQRSHKSETEELRHIECLLRSETGFRLMSFLVKRTERKLFSRLVWAVEVSFGKEWARSVEQARRTVSGVQGYYAVF